MNLRLFHNGVRAREEKLKKWVSVGSIAWAVGYDLSSAVSAQLTARRSPPGWPVEAITGA